MSGGVVFDLWALWFASIIAVGTWLVLDLRKNRSRPYDWEKDWPEYRYAKEAHVRQVK